MLSSVPRPHSREMTFAMPIVDTDQFESQSIKVQNAFQAWQESGQALALARERGDVRAIERAEGACAINEHAYNVAARDLSEKVRVVLAKAKQSPIQNVLCLDESAVEALARFRQADAAFKAVGHGSEEGANLYLDAECTAQDLGRKVAALIPEV